MVVVPEPPLLFFLCVVVLEWVGAGALWTGAGVVYTGVGVTVVGVVIGVVGVGAGVAATATADTTRAGLGLWWRR
jgi:hypothetical protein